MVLISCEKGTYKELTTGRHSVLNALITPQYSHTCTLTPHTHTFLSINTHCPYNLANSPHLITGAAPSPSHTLQKL